MIVSVLVRRLREGRTFEDFQAEWEADQGFGVPTRVFSAQSLDDPRDIITVGFVGCPPEQLAAWLAEGSTPEAVRHERIDTVIESTTLKGGACTTSAPTTDFTSEPRQIEIGSAESLLRALTAAASDSSET